jgi:hypothetical protein
MAGKQYLKSVESRVKYTKYCEANHISRIENHISRIKESLRPNEWTEASFFRYKIRFRTALLSLVDVQYAELGTTVNAVLSFRAVYAVSATVLQLALTVTTGYKATTVDAFANEVVRNTLGATLREALVSSSRTYRRGVRVDLDANVWTLTEEAQQAIVNNTARVSSKCCATVSVVDRKNVVASKLTVDLFVAAKATFRSHYFLSYLSVLSRNSLGANRSRHVDYTLGDVLVYWVNVDCTNFSSSSNYLFGVRRALAWS